MANNLDIKQSEKQDKTSAEIRDKIYDIMGKMHVGELLAMMSNSNSEFTDPEKQKEILEICDNIPEISTQDDNDKIKFYEGLLNKGFCGSGASEFIDGFGTNTIETSDQSEKPLEEDIRSRILELMSMLPVGELLMRLFKDFHISILKSDIVIPAEEKDDPSLHFKQRYKMILEIYKKVQDPNNNYTDIFNELMNSGLEIEECDRFLNLFAPPLREDEYNEELEKLYIRRLQVGDILDVKTENSQYYFTVVEKGDFIIVECKGNGILNNVKGRLQIAKNYNPNEVKIITIPKYGRSYNIASNREIMNDFEKRWQLEINDSVFLVADDQTKKEKVNYRTSKIQSIVVTRYLESIKN